MVVDHVLVVAFVLDRARHRASTCGRPDCWRPGPAPGDVNQRQNTVSITFLGELRIEPPHGHPTHFAGRLPEVALLLRRRAIGRDVGSVEITSQRVSRNHSRQSLPSSCASVMETTFSGAFSGPRKKSYAVDPEGHTTRGALPMEKKSLWDNPPNSPALEREADAAQTAGVLQRAPRFRLDLVFSLKKSELCAGPTNKCREWVVLGSQAASNAKIFSRHFPPDIFPLDIFFSPTSHRLDREIQSDHLDSGESSG